MGHRRKTPPETKERKNIESDLGDKEQKQEDQSAVNTMRSKAEGFNKDLNIIGGIIFTSNTIYTFCAEHKLLTFRFFAVAFCWVLMNIATKAGRWKNLLLVVSGMIAAGALRTVFVDCGWLVFHPPILEALSGEKKETSLSSSAGQSLYSSIDERAIHSTEAPDTGYEMAEKTEKLSEDSQREQLMNAGRSVGISGSKENFENFRTQILQTANECTQESNYAVESSKKRARITKNADEADQLTRKVYYNPEEGFTFAVKICELRKENYELFPSLNTATLMGNASLDCLCFMGMIREDSKKSSTIDISIFNKENATNYGDIAAEGFLQARMRAVRVQNYTSKGKTEYGLAQLFHRLGDISEFFSEEDLILSLGIAAVFYTECAVDDERCYEEGAVSEEQYNSAEYGAITFEKLDAKVNSQDGFFLEQAEKYYTYALRNENLGAAKRKKLEGYRQTIRNNLKQKARYE